MRRLEREEGRGEGEARMGGSLILLGRVIFLTFFPSGSERPCSPHAGSSNSCNQGICLPTLSSCTALYCFSCPSPQPCHVAHILIILLLVFTVTAAHPTFPRRYGIFLRWLAPPHKCTQLQALPLLIICPVPPVRPSLLTQAKNQELSDMKARLDLVYAHAHP